MASGSKLNSGYAFVEFEQPESIATAIAKFNRFQRSKNVISPGEHTDPSSDKSAHVTPMCGVELAPTQLATDNPDLWVMEKFVH